MNQVIGPNGSWRALDGRHSPGSAEEQKRIKAKGVGEMVRNPWYNCWWFKHVEALLVEIFLAQVGPPVLAFGQDIPSIDQC